MSVAKKCDACGKLFESIKGDNVVDGVILIHWRNGRLVDEPKWKALRYMDLCYDCAVKICHDVNYTTVSADEKQ